MAGTDVELTDVELGDVVHRRAQSPDAADAEPVCRICHDDLCASPGHPVTLKCACKGALRAAHAQCALRWFRSRGDAVCEICEEHTGLSLSHGVDRMRHQRVRGSRGGRRVFSRDASRRRDPAAVPGGEDDAADAPGSENDSAHEDDASARGGSDDDTSTWRARADSDATRIDAFTRRARWRSERARDAVLRGARRRASRAAWYRFFCGAVVPPTGDPGARPDGPDAETGDRTVAREVSLSREREGGAAICDLALLLAAVFTSQTLLLLSRAGDADPDETVVTPGLAVALAYMNSGAHLLGIVQMLVVLSVARLSRAKQVAVLWLWAAALGVGSWALLRRFMDPGHGGPAGGKGAAGEAKGALEACVIVSVSAAVSPTVAFWVVWLARVVAGCGERGR